MNIDIDRVVADFKQTLPLAGIDDIHVGLEIQNHGCPHAPRPLPHGKMAVYIFVFGGRVLKVGKVGPKSNARFQTHHYLPGSSHSNLAKSLLDDESGDCHDISADDIGSWMRQNLHRIDILMNSALGAAFLAYLEAFLHCRLKPVYEGFKSQRLVADL